MEDVPDNLKPASILLESIEQISQMKGGIISMHERDKELKDFIRSLTKKQRVDSCSHTLETLVRQLV